MTDVGVATLLAAAVALLGACIAWGQWNTARQKLVLDLFDRRVEKYEAFELALARMGTQGADSFERAFAIDNAGYQMRFLFSEETVDAIRQISNAAFEWHSAETAFVRATQMSGSRDERRIDELMDNAAAAQRRFRLRQQELDPLIAPYLRMDQKLPRTPTQWLKDRWNNRPDGKG